MILPVTVHELLNPVGSFEQTKLPSLSWKTKLGNIKIINKNNKHFSSF